MKPTEAVALARAVRAYCPQQAMDEFTPDAYMETFGGYPFTDAREAVKVLGGRQPFIAPADILAEIKRIRSARIAAAGDLTPPPGLTGPQEREWLSEARRRIGDGDTVTVDHGELKSRPIAALLSGKGMRRA